MDNLGDMFQAYFERRYPAARIAIEGSSQFSKLFHDQVCNFCVQDKCGDKKILGFSTFVLTQSCYFFF